MVVVSSKDNLQKKKGGTDGKNDKGNLICAHRHGIV